jgi:hypothetical protein
MYNEDIAPLMTSNTTNALNLTVTITANSTDNTTGRVQKINGFPYPNTWKNVLTGMGASVPLPFRCSNVNLSTSEVYSWM